MPSVDDTLERRGVDHVRGVDDLGGLAARLEAGAQRALDLAERDRVHLRPLLAGEPQQVQVRAGLLRVANHVEGGERADALADHVGVVDVAGRAEALGQRADLRRVDRLRPGVHAGLANRSHGRQRCTASARRRHGRAFAPAASRRARRDSLGAAAGGCSHAPEAAARRTRRELVAASLASLCRPARGCARVRCRPRAAAFPRGPRRPDRPALVRQLRRDGPRTGGAARARAAPGLRDPVWGFRTRPRAGRLLRAAAELAALPAVGVDRTLVRRQRLSRGDRGRRGRARGRAGGRAARALLALGRLDGLRRDAQRHGRRQAADRPQRRLERRRRGAPADRDGHAPERRRSRAPLRRLAARRSAGGGPERGRLRAVAQFLHRRFAGGPDAARSGRTVRLSSARATSPRASRSSNARACAASPASR